MTRCLFSNILANIGIVKGTVTRFNEIILKFYFTNFNNYKAELEKKIDFTINLMFFVGLQA